MAAKVCRTSPGCSGKASMIAGLPRAAGDRVDHLSKRDRLGVPEVVEVVARAALDRADDAVDDVVHVGVVAPGRAVAEHRHRLALIDQTRELGDGQVGSIPRAERGEEPQAGDRQAVQVVEGVRQQLAGFLGGGIGADGQVDRVGLAKRPVRRGRRTRSSCDA